MFNKFKDWKGTRKNLIDEITNFEKNDKKLLEKTFSKKEGKEVIIKLAKSKNEISLSKLAEKNAKQSLTQKLIQSDTNNDLIDQLSIKFKLNKKSQDF